MVVQVSVVSGVTEYDMTETTETVTDSVTAEVTPGNDLYQDNPYNYRCQNNFEVFADPSTSRAFSDDELHETTMYSEDYTETDPGAQTVTCWDWATNTTFYKTTHGSDLRVAYKRIRNPYPDTAWWQWMLRMTGDQNLSIRLEWSAYDWTCPGATCDASMLELDVERVVGDKYHVILWVPSVDAFTWPGFPPLEYGASAYLECPESNLMVSGHVVDPVLEIGWEETAGGNARFTLGWRWPGGNTSVSVTNTSTVPLTLHPRLELEMYGEDWATTGWNNDIILLAENSNFRTGLFKEFDRQYVDDMFHYQPANTSFRFDMTSGASPAGWNVFEGPDGTVTMQTDTWYGHRNILNVSCDGGGSGAHPYGSLYPGVSYNISWWWWKSQDAETYIQVYDHATPILTFQWDALENLYDYHTGAFHLIDNPPHGQWLHVTLDIDPATDTYWLWIDQVLVVGGRTMRNPTAAGATYMNWQMEDTTNGYFLLDAFDSNAQAGYFRWRNSMYDNDTCAFTYDSPWSLWEANCYHEITEFDRDDIGIAEPTSGWRYPLPGDTPQYTTGAGLDSVTVPAYATMRTGEPYGQYQWLEGGKATRSGAGNVEVHWSGYNAGSDNPLSLDEDWLWVGCLTVSKYWDFIADFGAFWLASDNYAYNSADGRDGFTVPVTWWGDGTADAPSFEREYLGTMWFDANGFPTSTGDIVANRYGEQLERDRRYDAAIPCIYFVGYDVDTRLIYLGEYVDGIVYWNTWSPHYAGWNIDTSRFTNEPDVFHYQGASNPPTTTDAYYFGSFLHRGDWLNSFNTSATTRPLNASYLWEHPALMPPDPGSGYDFEYARLNCTVDDLPATDLYTYYTCLCDLTPAAYVTWGEASTAGWWSSSFNSTQQAYGDLNEEYLRPEYPARYSWLSVYFDGRPVNNTNSSWDLFYPEMYQVEYDMVLTATWCAWSTNVAVSNDLLNEIIEMTVPFLLCLLFPWVAVMVTHRKIFAPIGGILGAIISYLSGMLTFGETILVAGLYAGLFAFLQRYNAERGETAW